MSRHPLRQRTGVICVALICLLAGCDNGRPTEKTQPDGLENIITQAQQTCVVSIEGEKLFGGERRCLSKLPQRRMSGLWVLGHEHSVFFENATELPQESDGEVWLEAEPYETFRPFGVNFDGKTHVYRVSFIGTKSDAPGVYGHAGSFRRGALVLRMISAEEVTQQMKLR